MAHPAFLPSPSPAVAGFVCADVLPAFQTGCGMEQGAVTGIPVPQPGSFWSLVSSLAFLLLMGCGQVAAAFREVGNGGGWAGLAALPCPSALCLALG